MAKLKVLTVDGKIVRGPGGMLMGGIGEPFLLNPEQGVEGTQVTITGDGFATNVDSDTKLLLHFDGTGTSFVDSSPTPKTGIQAYGSATQSATQSRFGGKSLYCALAADYVTVPNSSDFAFGNGSFTIDWWEYRTAYVNNAAVASKYGGTAYTPFLVGYQSNYSNYVYFSSNGTSWDMGGRRALEQQS